MLKFFYQCQSHYLLKNVERSLRLFLALFVFVFTPIYAQESLPSKHYAQDESLALVYLGYGNANLLAGDYACAIENFQLASLCSKRSANHSYEIDFLVAFGEAIAFDNLGLKDECQSCIGSLFVILSEEEQSLEEGSFEESNEDTLSSSDYEEINSQLHKLANLAPSAYVRELLCNIVDEMASEVLPTFKTAQSPSGKIKSWKFSMHKEFFSLRLCKSRFWKNMKKIAVKIYKWVIAAKEAYEFLERVIDTIDEGNSNDIKKNPI